MARLLDADDLIAELEASCMPIHEKGISGIPGDNSSIADIINSLHSEKENEPAPAATGTSSEVSKDTSSILHLDDSTKAAICQAYDTVDEACTDIIGIYEGMSEREHRAFDIGEAYGKICSTRDKLDKLRGGDGNEH